MIRLEGIYARLPKIECRGLCHEACGPVIGSREETARIEATTGRRLGVTPSLTCTMLGADKKCAGYSARPLICRLFGVVKAMRCPHGCQPERWLSDREAHALLAEVGS